MRVIFRASFKGRQGALGTPGFIWPNPPVEDIDVFRKVDSWYARSVLTGHNLKLQPEPSHGAMKDAVVNAFKLQCSPWTMLDTDGKPVDLSRIQEDPKGNFERLPETHVGAPGDSQTDKKNLFKTACGSVTHVSQIYSVRGHKAPTCEACKAVWAKTPDSERLKKV